MLTNEDIWEKDPKELNSREIEAILRCLEFERSMIEKNQTGMAFAEKEFRRAA